MKDKEKMDAHKASTVRGVHKWFTPVMSLLIFIVVCFTMFKVDEIKNELASSGGIGGQKVASNISQISGEIADLKNTVDVLAQTGGGAGLGGKDLQAVEKINKKADKYHVIYLTKEIIERINNTKDYSDKMDDLTRLLNGKFPDQLAELEKNKGMAILSHEEMVKIVEESTQVAKPTTEQEKSAFESIKSVFKTSGGKDDDLKIKCNPIVIDSAVKNLREKNEWEALKTLEQVEPKNDGLKKVVDNLNLRNILKYYLNQIADETLKNG